MASIFELKRNDVEGAIKAYRAAVETAENWWEFQSIARSLMMLQDDPDKLGKALEKIDREPKVAGALRRLEADR